MTTLLTILLVPVFYFVFNPVTGLVIATVCFWINRAFGSAFLLSGVLVPGAMFLTLLMYSITMRGVLWGWS